MNNNRLFTLIIIMSLVVLPSVVSAAGAFDSISNVLNDLVEQINPGARDFEDAGLQPWVGMFLVFFLFFSLFAASLGFTHLRGRYANTISVVLAAWITTSETLLVMVAGFMGLFFVILVPVLIFFLFRLFWKSRKIGDKEMSSALNAATAKESQTHGARHEAEKDERRLKHDLDISKKLNSQEKSALKDASNAAERMYTSEADLNLKLEQVQQALNHLAKAQTGSPEAEKLKKGVMEQLATIVHTARDESPVLETLKRAEEKIHELDLKDYKGAADENAVAQKLRDKIIAGSGKSPKIDSKKIVEMASRIHHADKERVRISTELQNLIAEETNKQQQFEQHVTEIINYLSNNDFTNALQEAQRAMQFNRAEMQLTNKIKSLMHEMEKLLQSTARLQQTINKNNRDMARDLGYS